MCGKIKICVLCFSRNKNSRTKEIINEVLERINEQFGSENLDIDYINHELLNVSVCQGCNNCFYNGFCIQDDDMTMLQEKLLEADIIIFGTPVYINFISGEMKSFLDRIAYWTHLMPLLGKYAIIVTASSNSGVSEALKYMYDISCYYGLDVIGAIGEARTMGRNETLINIDILVNRLQRIKNFKECIKPNQFRENIFRQFADIYRSSLINNNTAKNFEAKYWEQNEYLKFERLFDLMDNKNKICK